jgi:hypothetical protein
MEKLSGELKEMDWIKNDPDLTTKTLQKLSL